jgi:hypothetical protein
MDRTAVEVTLAEQPRAADTAAAGVVSSGKREENIAGTQSPIRTQRRRNDTCGSYRMVNP